MKHWGWIVLGVLLLSIAGWYKFGAATPAINCLYTDATKKVETICAYNLKNNAVVTSPLKLTGRARGNWYFEASFPVELLDQTGAILAQIPAQAQGDWMTEDLVPFEAELNFTLPIGVTTGTVVLKKDNPSGLPQNDASFSIPVRFH